MWDVDTAISNYSNIMITEFNILSLIIIDSMKCIVAVWQDQTWNCRVEESNQDILWSLF